MLLALLIGCGDDPAPPPVAPPPTKEALDTGVIPEAEEEEDEPREANRRPKFLKLVLKPDAPTVESTIDAKVEVKDPDGDLVDVDLYWYVNDEEIKGFRGRQLTSTHFRKGDVVKLAATASDGKNEHRKEAEPLTIANASPTIELPRNVTSIDGLQLEASDPDGDSLTWRVEEAPPGFTISTKGRITYKGSMDVTETTTYTTRIVAEDTSGDFAVWEMGLTVEAAQQPTQSYTRPGGDVEASEEGAG